MADLKQPNRVRGLKGAHGKEVADRQERQLRSIQVTEQSHVAEEPGVSCSVHREAIFQGDYVSCWFAARLNRKSTR